MTNILIFNLQILFAGVLLLFAIKKHPDLVRIEIRRILYFSAFFIPYSFISAAISAFQDPLGMLQNFLQVKSSMPLDSFFGVYWEDMFFVFPYLLALKKYKHKALALFPIFVFTTLYFASGHMYQGEGWLITAIYPPISLYFGRKYGLGTMMVIHILYDSTIVMSSFFAYYSYLYLTL